eukprot:TRINITY_DN3467_c0_g2_i1.p2 TRINITY_DN3467_c0_g2~~TRINITY_DN3467_c0_g2_i1.p2  ORF type:complete len:145 (+),score=14.00 TRINITY_DN3467_c0_g2_i1:66-500(+)
MCIRDSSQYLLVEDIENMIKEMQASHKHFSEKFRSFNEKIGEVLANSNMTQFCPLEIEDKLSVSNLLAAIDRANGYSYYMQAVRKNKEKFRELREKGFEFDNIFSTENIMDLEEKLFAEEMEHDLQEELRISKEEFLKESSKGK